MQAPIEERIEKKERDTENKGSAQKKQAMAALVIAVIALMIVPVIAWFYIQRSMTSVTRINEPQALMIGAGNAQAIASLELGDIDVTGTQKYKDVVFCIYSYQQLKYHLQLAHTTNIGLDYTIYPATKGSGGGTSLINYLGEDYSFDTESKVAGSYLNRDSSTKHALQSGVFHDRTYSKLDGNSGTYSNVQQSAEPLYWKTTEELRLPDTKIGTHYINYYVLRISWDGKNVQNNKETDMIYLMAESTGNVVTETTGAS